jgi:hypothetical protein
MALHSEYGEGPSRKENNPENQRSNEKKKGGHCTIVNTGSGEKSVL